MGERGSLSAQFTGRGQDLIGAAARALDELADAGYAVRYLAGTLRRAVHALSDFAGDEILLVHGVGDGAGNS